MKNLPAKFQLRRLFSRMPFIPIWTFFAPVPLSSNYNMMFRYMYEDSSLSLWDMLIDTQKINPWKRIILNPEKRFQKTVIDFTNTLIKMMNDHSKHLDLNMRFSEPYLSILNYISNKNIPSQVIKLQFCITSTDKNDGTSIILLSEFHAIEHS